MQAAEHDPLQFGSETQLANDHADAHPAAYGADEVVEPSAPPVEQGWQHYPDLAHELPSPTSHPSPPAAASQQHHQPQHHYPPVPNPDSHTNIPLASTASSSIVSSPRSSTMYPPLQPPGTPSSLVGAYFKESPDLHISVRHPQQYAAGPAIPVLTRSYMTYELVTLTNLPHFSAQQVVVRRRFKDFVSLSRLLPQHLHGSFLPARPHRNAIETARNTAAFIMERRSALERYMNRLASHKDVARSEVLRVFLEAEGNLRCHPSWLALKPRVLTPAQSAQRLIKGMVSGGGGAAPSPSEVVQPAGVGRDVYRMLHERTASLRRRSEPLTSDEVALREAEVLLEDLGSAQAMACSRSARCVAALEAASAAHAALATALGAVGSYEASCGRRDTTDPLTVASQGCSRASSGLAAAAASTSSCLTPLVEYSEMQPNVMAALAGRRVALGTVNTLAADLDAVRGRLATLSLTPASQAKRVESLRSHVSALEAALSAAQGEYQRQVSRNATEMTTFRRQRAQELMAMMEHLASEQARQWSSLSTTWQEVLGQLQAVQPNQAAASPSYHRAAMGTPAAAGE